MQEWINGIFDVLVGEAYKVLFYDIYGFPLIVLTLLFGSITFTLYFRFINIRAFKHSIEVIKGKYDNPKDKGQISHFQALTSALSGTIGLGNIAGVAIAVTLGGPGAVFWMMFIALFSMSAKFVSGTLSQMYRKINSDGSIDGGPMYYLDMGLKETGRPKLGRFLGITYAIFIIGGALGGGNMFQSNQSFSLVSDQLPFLKDFGWLYGMLLAILVGAVIIGGIKRIGKATEKIVPLMVVIYILASLFIIFTHIDRLPNVIGLIFSEAFNASAIYGGLIGSIVQGIRRAVFSNEGGVGSASIAHSAAKTDEPVREGIVAMIGPFIDTIVICFMTACVILITRAENEDYQIYQNDLKHQLISKEIDGLRDKKTNTSEQRDFINNKIQKKQDSLEKINKILFSLEFAYDEKFNDINMNKKWDDAEPFTDLNGNGRWDGPENYYDSPDGVWTPGEPFTDSDESGWRDFDEDFEDLNGNLRWDGPEPFADLNGNGKWDKGEFLEEDDRGNNKWDDAEPFEDLNGNGRWDGPEPFTDSRGDFKWNDAEPFNDLDSSGDWSIYYDTLKNLWLYEPFTDLNGNKKWDDAELFTDMGNNVWDDTEPFEDENENGKRDHGYWQEFKDANRNGEWDYDEEGLFWGHDDNYYEGRDLPYVVDSFYVDGEPFEDLNGNGWHDFSEKFTDNIIVNGEWDQGEELKDLGNRRWDQGEEFEDKNGKWDEGTDKAEGAILTSSAFGSVIWWFPAILAVVVFLFSYSTMISWYYYGDKSWTYLFGRKSIGVFQAIYLGCVVLGAIASLGSIIDFSDMMLLSAAFPNIIGVMFLLPKLRDSLNKYWKKYQNKEFKTYETSFVKNLFSFKSK